MRVTFEPGARTAWHTHPLGQTLHVITGVGRAQTWGGPVRELRPGDTVWIPPQGGPQVERLLPSRRNRPCQR